MPYSDSIRYSHGAAICARRGVPLRAAAIPFPLAHPAVACVITGARTAEEIADDEQMLRVDVASDLWAELGSHGLLPEHAPALA
jgi:D-threo-aldose 1-dehydrogenase